MERTTVRFLLCALDALSSSNTTFVAEGLLPNTPYYLRVVATGANGTEIYDSGRVSTLDKPDASGWYSLEGIENLTVPGDGFTTINSLTHGNYGPTGWTFAGSAAGGVPGGAPWTGGRRVGAHRQQQRRDVPSITTPRRSASPAASHTPFPRTSAATPAQPAGSSFTPNGAQPPAPQSSPQDLSTNMAGRAAGPAAGKSADPIVYFDGTVDYDATDLESDGLGSAFTQSRSWTNQGQWSAGQMNVRRHGRRRPEHGQRLDQRPGPHAPAVRRREHDLSDPLGHRHRDLRVVRLRPAVRAAGIQRRHARPQPQQPIRLGRLAGQPDRLQRLYCRRRPARPVRLDDRRRRHQDRRRPLEHRCGLARAITEIDRYDADGTVVERWKYSYNASGSLYNAGLLNSVQLCRSDGQGNWPVVQQVLYGYYDGTYAGDDQYGNLGDLKTATVEDGSNNVLGIDYYRYYTPTDIANGGIGYVGGLKYVFDAASYGALAANVGDPAAAPDYEVKPDAQHYFEYDQEHRVTEHDVQGAGATAAGEVGVAATGGIGTFYYTYQANPAYSADDPNAWDYCTQETLPDGNENVVYCNFLGEVTLNEFVDARDPSIRTWTTRTGTRITSTTRRTSTTRGAR